MIKGLSQADAGLYVEGIITIDPDPDAPPVGQAPIASGTFNPPDSAVGQVYDYATAPLFSGGVPISYSLGGVLPDGLSLNTSTGVISGVSTTEETQNANVTATNADGSDTTNTGDIVIGAVSAGWVQDYSFDGPLGENAQAGGPDFNPTGYTTGVGTDTTFSNEETLGGQATSGKNVVDANPSGQGYNHWGGGFTHPSPLYLGGEIWFRVFIFWPIGTNFSTGVGLLKCMRVGTVYDGGNSGYHDYAVRPYGGQYMVVGNELGADTQEGLLPPYTGPGTSDLTPTGQWHCWEMYVYFHDDPNQGIVRCWQNDNLIYDVFTDTISDKLNARSDRCLMHTIWNDQEDNPQPLTPQWNYISHVRIQSQTPGAVDSFGNPFIGSEGLLP